MTWFLCFLKNRRGGVYGSEYGETAGIRESELDTIKLSGLQRVQSVLDFEESVTVAMSIRFCR